MGMSCIFFAFSPPSVPERWRLQARRVPPRHRNQPVASEAGTFSSSSEGVQSEAFRSRALDSSAAGERSRLPAIAEQGQIGGSLQVQQKGERAEGDSLPPTLVIGALL